MVGIGESSVDYSGSIHNNSASRDQPAITSSLADVEAMLKVNNITGDGHFASSNSQMQSTGENHSSIFDPNGSSAIVMQESWAPIEGTTPKMIDSRNIGSPSAEQPHETLSATLRQRNTRANNVRSQGVGQRKQQSKPRNIFKESYDHGLMSPKNERAVTGQDPVLRQSGPTALHPLATNLKLTGFVKGNALGGKTNA